MDGGRLSPVTSLLRAPTVLIISTIPIIITTMIIKIVIIMIPPPVSHQGMRPEGALQESQTVKSKFTRRKSYENKHLHHRHHCIALLLSFIVTSCLWNCCESSLLSSTENNAISVLERKLDPTKRKRGHSVSVCFLFTICQTWKDSKDILITCTGCGDTNSMGGHKTFREK